MSENTKVEIELSSLKKDGLIVVAKSLNINLKQRNTKSTLIEKIIERTNSNITNSNSNNGNFNNNNFNNNNFNNNNFNNNSNLLVDIIIFDKDKKYILQSYSKNINIKNSNIPFEDLDKYLFFSTDTTDYKLYTDYETKLFEIIEEDLQKKLNNLNKSINIGIMIVVNNKLWYSYIDNKEKIKKILSESYNNININIYSVKFYKNRINQKLTKPNNNNNLMEPFELN